MFMYWMMTVLCTHGMDQPEDVPGDVVVFMLEKALCAMRPRFQSYMSGHSVFDSVICSQPPWAEFYCGLSSMEGLYTNTNLKRRLSSMLAVRTARINREGEAS